MPDTNTETFPSDLELAHNSWLFFFDALSPQQHECMTEVCELVKESNLLQLSLKDLQNTITLNSTEFY